MDDHSLTRRRSGWKRAISGAASLILLVFIVVGVIPQFGSYSNAWARVTHLSAWYWVALGVAAAVNQLSGAWPYLAAMPGLRLRDGVLQIETATAISNTVPAGGAVAIGLTFRMFSSFGFGDVVISAAVLTTGIWNFGAKFALPIAAIGLLALTEHVPVAVVDASIAGSAALVVSGFLLWSGIRSEASAHWVGRPADRVVNRVLHQFGKPPLPRIERALLSFRSQMVRTMRGRGWLLTLATAANQVAGFVLVVVIVRAVGITGGQLSLAEIFASFAVARLAGAIPITPGSLGTFDAAFIGIMTTFGAQSSQALTADLLWRMTTYLAPTLFGVVTYLIWVRSKRPAQHSSPSSAPPSELTSPEGGGWAAPAAVDGSGAVLDGK